jgi:hypothetical protein
MSGLAETFSQSALALAGASSRLLGWPPDWFWQSTPAELAAILLLDGTGTREGMSRRELETLMESDRDGR